MKTLLRRQAQYCAKRASLASGLSKNVHFDGSGMIWNVLYEKNMSWLPDLGSR